MRTTIKLSVFLMAALWLCLPFTVQSQVKIGEEELPTKGAILDLKKTTTSTTNFYIGGLLLPNVNLTTLEDIPTTFTAFSSSSEGIDINADLIGMIVYNKNTKGPGPENPDGISPGIYVWDGDRWQPVAF